MVFEVTPSYKNPTNFDIFMILHVKFCVLLQDCMYLHELGEEAASFTKEEMQMG